MSVRKTRKWRSERSTSLWAPDLSLKCLAWTSKVGLYTSPSDDLTVRFKNP